MMGLSGNVLFVFLLCSIAMFTLPFLTFFATKNVLEKKLHMTGFANTAWSVISAVVVVNLIIITYAWRAYKQEVQEESQKTEDTQPNKDLGVKKND